MTIFLNKLFTHYYTHRLLSAFRTFRLAGKTYHYFVHRYNATWRNERTVEVPIIWREVEDAYAKKLNVLELGNVLTHYFPIRHTVVDKYEQADGVVNADIIEYKTKEKFDLIVSISTLEHVGWDEQKKDPRKTKQAVEKIRSMLNKGGKAVITVPLGYNPDMEKLLKNNELGFDEIKILRRVNLLNDWIEADLSIIGNTKYGQPFANANGVVIGYVYR